MARATCARFCLKFGFFCSKIVFMNDVMDVFYIENSENGKSCQNCKSCKDRAADFSTCEHIIVSGLTRSLVFISTKDDKCVFWEEANEEKKP